MATNKKDTDLVALARIAELAKSNGDKNGFITGGLNNSDFSILLGGCIDFHADIPEFEQKKIVTRVSYDSTISRPITDKALLKQCSKLEQEYLVLPKKSFRLLTEISIYWTIDIPKTTFGDVTITFNPKTVKGFAKRSHLFKDVQAEVGFLLPENYKRLSILVSARTHHEAAEKALNGIDLVRASWNLALNRGKTWRHSSGRPSPVNDIRLSPFHTIHDSTGALASETYWYDPIYTKPASLYSDKSQFEKLQKFAKNIRVKLAQLPYRRDLESALIRYVRALDSADLNDAFLRLWSLLEYLTYSGHDPYRVTIRRTEFMYRDRERTRLILTHLAQHRNSFVHAGSDSDEIESLVFLLKQHVDQLLLFHIGNTFGFTTRKEAAEFMDMPPDKDEIDKRINRLRSARKFVFGKT